MSARLVVDVPGDFGRAVLLFHPTPRFIVRVYVAVTVTETLRSGIVGVAQVAGHVGPRAPAGIFERSAERGGDRVRFRCRCEIYDRLGEIQLSFWEADELDGSGRGVGH